MNITFHVAEEFRHADGFTQPNSDREQPAEQGKHYVAFVVSDGDNAQYWQNTAIFSTSYMNATGRADDDFAVTWSISPSIAELMPLVMDAAYNGDITTEYDYFCAPVSGQGYIDAGNFYNAGAAYMNTFLGNLDTYLQRSDLRVTTIIGAENYSGGIYGTLDAYASVDSLEGGLVLNGNKYFGGAYSGGVYWKDGKPFNYELDNIPRTQDIPALYEETSGFYIYRQDVITKLNRRIGNNPYIVEVGEIESVDIDEPEDFIIADAIYNYQRAQNNNGKG